MSLQACLPCTYRHCERSLPREEFCLPRDTLTVFVLTCLKELQPGANRYDPGRRFSNKELVSEKTKSASTATANPITITAALLALAVVCKVRSTLRAQLINHLRGFLQLFVYENRTHLPSISCTNLDPRAHRTRSCSDGWSRLPCESTMSRPLRSAFHGYSKN